MFGYDLAEFRISEVKADLPTDFRMTAIGIQTECFRDIMKQCPRDNFVFVRKRTGTFAGSAEIVKQRLGDPGDNKGVRLNILKHLEPVVKLKALVYGRNALFHINCQPGIPRLSAAQFVNRVNGNFCLLRWRELVNAVTKIENMTIRIFRTIE
jgi:hypothetical protein